METATIETWAADEVKKLAVIERLCRCEREDNEASYISGLEAGTSWAQDEARPSDLRRLEKIDLGEFFDFDPEQQPEAPGEMLADAVLGDGCREDELFADGQSGDLHFVKGFATGAWAVWLNVKDKVR